MSQDDNNVKAPEADTAEKKTSKWGVVRNAIFGNKKKLPNETVTTEGAEPDKKNNALLPFLKRNPEEAPETKKSGLTSWFSKKTPPAADTDKPPTEKKGFFSNWGKKKEPAPPPPVEENMSPEKLEAMKTTARAFMADFAKTDIVVACLVLTSLFFTIIAAVIALIFIISAIQKISNGFLITNPINEGSLDYRVAISISSLLPKGYNYVYFLILPWLQLLPLIGIGIYFYYNRNKPGFREKFSIGTIFILLIAILGIHSLICIVFNYIVYYSAYDSIRLVTRRIGEFNDYVYDRMYKGVKKDKKAGSVLPSMPTVPSVNQLTSSITNLNAESIANAADLNAIQNAAQDATNQAAATATSASTAAAAAIAEEENVSSLEEMPAPSDKPGPFYKELNSVQNNPIAVKVAAQKALRRLPENVDSDDLAKAMFTANLYIHYHKLGVRNPSILDAIDLFKPHRLLLRWTFNPADYLFRRSTFIDDLSETFGSNTSNFLRPELLKKQKVIMEAMAKNAEWIAEATNQANNIFPEDTVVPFFRMAVMMMFVQIFIPMLILQLLKEPGRRSKVFGFLTRMLLGGSVVY